MPEVDAVDETTEAVPEAAAEPESEPVAGEADESAAEPTDKS